MPRFGTIKASDAPTPSTRLKATTQILNAINRLEHDDVLRLQPEPGETMRGLKVSLGRVVSSNNLKIDMWTDAFGNALYVRKAR